MDLSALKTAVTPQNTPGSPAAGLSMFYAREDHDHGIVPGGAGTDTTAIHDNVAGEIDAISEKASPVDADIVIIEDSEDSNNKKKVQLSNMLGGSYFEPLTNGAVATPELIFALGDVIMVEVP
jgi:hypothetical protein